MNPEGLPQLSGACLYSNPPLLLSLRVFLTPPSFGHLPYILLCKTQGRRVRVTFRSLRCNTPHTGHGKGRRLNTNDFLSLSKKVLVTLIRFICSFFSTARRTNQEAPPQLSGLLACRYGRRRGLRNSFRSDSPRPFPFVSLASSPPDKGGIGDCALACILTPSVLLTPPSFGHLPYILLYKTPRNATGHGKGRG